MPLPKLTMNRSVLSLALCGTMAVLALLSGCDERDPGNGADAADTTAGYDLTFATPSFTNGRRLDTLFSVDLDDDGRREYVVTSLAPDRVMSPGARSDLVQIYRFDTLSRSWKIALSDTLLWATTYNLREMTGDRAPEVIASVIAGGNDPIASNGLRIYSGHGGTIRAIFSRDDGDPQVGKIGDGDLPVVILHDLIWPPLVPHVQSVPYVADLLAFDGTGMTSVRARHVEYFRKEAETHLAEYAKALKEADVPTSEMVGENGLADAEVSDGGLFASAAQTLIAFDQAEQTEALRSFWNRQRDTLRVVLPQEQYDQLEELYAKRIMR